MFKGIDVSSVQGNVDYNWLAAQGITFVIVKCYTGNDGKDPFYEKNIKAAQDAGLKVGLYHFVYPLPASPAHPNRDPIGQANLHFQASGDLGSTIPVHCIDLEFPGSPDWAKWGCSADQIKQWTVDYVNEYERLSGKEMVFYSYYYFATPLKFDQEFAKRKLWIASYQANPQIPAPWTDYTIWQAGGGNTGMQMKTKEGVIVDVNLMRDLSLWEEQGAKDISAIVSSVAVSKTDLNKI